MLFGKCKTFCGKVLPLHRVRDIIRSVEDEFGVDGWLLTMEKLSEVVSDAISEAESEALEAVAFEAENGEIKIEEEQGNAKA